MFGGEQTTSTPAARAAASIASASAMVVATGFSVTRCRPAARICSDVSACTGIGVRLATASMSARSSMSAREPYASGMPKRSATARARPGTVSAMAVTCALAEKPGTFGKMP